MQIVRAGTDRPRAEAFEAIAALARARAGFPPASARAAAAPVPYVSEPWYCCAEPMETV